MEMSLEEKYPRAIKLYKNASIWNVINEYKEQLCIKEFNIIPKAKFDLKKFLDKPYIINVKNITLPNSNILNIIANAEMFKKDMTERLSTLKDNPNMSKETKLNLINASINECKQMEFEYNPNNRFIVGLYFSWKIDTNHIPFSCLKFTDPQMKYIKNEIFIRYELFNWIRLELENSYRENYYQTGKKLIKWKTKSRNQMKIAEFIWALEKSGEVEFESDSDKRKFQSELIEVFNLKQIKWSELNAEIKRRKKDKLVFLSELIKSLT